MEVVTSLWNRSTVSRLQLCCRSLERSRFVWRGNLFLASRDYMALEDVSNSEVNDLGLATGLADADCPSSDEFIQTTAQLDCVPNRGIRLPHLKRTWDKQKNKQGGCSTSKCDPVG
ncbi:hypothetical protein TcWFU_000668 [Taenia crassiceps]|uniref:Uncharacterized protein n=1 Tax=Taenia crassiceps TaxID=6207 RepID=A0ABR4QFG2_9CEST